MNFECAASTYRSAYPEECADLVDMYPSCFCSNACGPFTSLSKGYEVVRDAFGAFYLSSALYTLLSKHSVLIWVVVALFHLRGRIQANKIKIEEDRVAKRERQHQVDLAGVKQQLRRKTKEAKKLEMQLKFEKDQHEEEDVDVS